MSLVASLEFYFGDNLLETSNFNDYSEKIMLERLRHARFLQGVKIFCAFLKKRRRKSRKARKVSKPYNNIARLSGSNVLRQNQKVKVNFILKNISTG